MINWLRLLLMTFYAPIRGMREVRDKAPLAPTAFLSFLTQVAYLLVTRKFAGSLSFSFGGAIFREIFQAAITVVLIAVVLVPILTLIANAFDRRGSFRVVITQEYAPVATSMFYVLMTANLVSILIAIFLHYSGIQADQVAIMIQQSDQTRAMLPNTPQFAAAAEQLKDPGALSESLFFMPKVVVFTIGMIAAVRDSFRISAFRAIGVTFIGCLLAGFVAPLAVQLFSGVLGSPFLIILVFFLLRGYFSEIVGTQRARAAFKQNLEAATLNPADASAHYNLGLIHQNRGELDQARERFERAVQIDPEEIDAYYQLGRIARQQKRYADAVQNFEQVVARDPAHSQHEIWREVAATYISAGQFDDARSALEQFLEHRPNDPEGLYLMGRAHAGLGHNREATSLMHACIEAVKTAPAYKYRSSKRWLNEAEQFIKGGQ
jgi:tetratricopeptide (TPR) repeat protein